MTLPVILEQRLDLGADLLRDRAAGAEAAAGGRVDRARDVALEHDPLVLAARDRLRVRREERHRVRVERPAEELLRGRQLDDLAEVHHRDSVGDVADDGEVVGDEEVRQVEVLLQLDEEVQHLRLDRDVERRHRLVGDDELRPEHEGAREADALPLAAAELMRVAAGRLGAEADALEHVEHRPLAALAVDAVDLEPLADELLHRHPRVEGADGVLEDDLHVAALALELARAEARQVDAFELDHAGGRLEKADQRPAERRLAAAGLPDEPDGLAAEDVEVDAVDGLQLADRALENALPDGKVLLDRARPDERVRRRGLRDGLRLGAHATTWRSRDARRPLSQSQHADSCGGTGRSGGSSPMQRSKA